MALFQKKPLAGTSVPLYTLGSTKTVLIVGLGNIGREYSATRHNIGFASVDTLVEKSELGPWAEKKDMKSYQASGQLGDTRVIAIKPTTYMNLSGEAVRATMDFYKIGKENIVVVHDELDIPFGQIRTRVGGQDAGNNGIKSIIQHIGEDFGRVRIGIRTETPMDSKDFVLSKFNEEEQKQLPNLYREVTAILTEYIYGDGTLPHETRTFTV